MRSDYFFFRRFVAFAFFAFLFFAIAALLATECGDVGTVQSWIDVHYIPITPARQQKTLTPLNGACTRAQTPPAIARIMMGDIAANTASMCAASSQAAQNSDTAKTHMSSAFFGSSAMKTFVLRAAENLIHAQFPRSANRDLVSLLHC